MLDSKETYELMGICADNLGHFTSDNWIDLVFLPEAI